MERNKLDELRQRYPRGTKIKLNYMNDDIHPVPSGTLGKVTYVDDIGTIHMVWETGSSLGLIEEEDDFEIISYPEKIIEFNDSEMSI